MGGASEATRHNLTRKGAPHQQPLPLTNSLQLLEMAALDCQPPRRQRHFSSALPSLQRRHPRRQRRMKERLQLQRRPLRPHLFVRRGRASPGGSSLASQGLHACSSGEDASWWQRHRLRLSLRRRRKRTSLQPQQHFSFLGPRRPGPFFQRIRCSIMAPTRRGQQAQDSLRLSHLEDRWVMLPRDLFPQRPWWRSLRGRCSSAPLGRPLRWLSHWLRQRA